MARVRVNMTGADKGFEPISEGLHLFSITGAEIKDNKAGDGQYINWECVVQEGEDTGKKTWVISSLKEEAKGPVRNFLMKVSGRDIPCEEDFEIDTDDYVGCSFLAEVEHEYNSELDRINVKLKKFQTYEGR